VWELNDDVATPPLPGVIRPKSPRRDAPATRVPLNPGCWLVQLVPFFSDDYDSQQALYPILRGWTLRYVGTLRVEQPAAAVSLRASGDLYLQRSDWRQTGGSTPPPLSRLRLPKEASGTDSAEIPVFPRKDYALYFTVQEIKSTGQGIVMHLAVSPFDAKTGTWQPTQILRAELERPAPEKIPADWSVGEHYYSGVVFNQQHTRVAKMEIGWISEFLREASLGITAAPKLQAPLEATVNGVVHSVRGVFEKLGWHLRIRDPITSELTAQVWESKDLHAAMLALQSKVDFDQEWRYNVLVVPRFSSEPVYGFGMMYDGDSLDTDLVPREGIVVAAESRFPSEDRFGGAKGQMLKDVPAAGFCDFLHELGHAMGLVHRFRGTGFMQELVYFANPAATQQASFPDNLTFSYDPLDELRLRHHPDPWVRSGGVPLGAGYTALPVPHDQVETDVSAELPLFAAPLDELLPLGAPVKLQLRLTNQTSRPLPGPLCLSLAKGSVAGRVIAPNGVVRTFSAVSPLDYQRPADLAPGRSLFHGETLWRGPDGALFPTPGLYRIELVAGWVAPGGVATTRAGCNVLISAPRNDRHEAAALRLLACEDVVALLVFRASPDGNSDEVNRRIAAAAEVLRDCVEVEELRPSLAPIQAQLVAGRSLEQAAALLDETSQLNTSEIENLLKLAKDAKPDFGRGSALGPFVVICRRKLRQAVRAGYIDRAELERITSQKEST
jgi:hypothetical protein